MWQPLHIEAKPPITHLHDQPMVTSSLQGQQSKLTSLNEQKLGTTSTEKRAFGTSLSQGPAMGTTSLQKPTTKTPPVPDLTTRIIHLQEQPLRTTPLQKKATGTTLLQEKITFLPESASRKKYFPGDARKTTLTSSATVHIPLSSTSSFHFVPTLTEKKKGAEKNEGSQTPQSQNNSIDETNRIAKIFAYLLGSILIIMVVTAILIWKCVAKQATVDTNWAGRSPLADSEFYPDLPVPTVEVIQCIQRPSITSNNLFPGMFSKKQTLLEDDSVQANSSKDNLSKQCNQDGENQVGQSNPTLDILNPPATMSPSLNVPGELKPMPKLMEMANSEQHSVVSTKLVNESAFPEPSKIPSLELPSPRSCNGVPGNTEVLANHLDTISRDEQTQMEPQLFPRPPSCILNEDRLEEFPPPSPEVY